MSGPNARPVFITGADIFMLAGAALATYGAWLMWGRGAAFFVGGIALFLLGHFGRR